MWHFPSLLRIANLVQYQSLLLRKIVQMWYLLHICCNLATLVNPFFRPVRLASAVTVSRRNGCQRAVLQTRATPARYDRAEAMGYKENQDCARS